MDWSTHVHTTHSSDTTPSIVITFDSSKYLINAGENTNRALFQTKGRGKWKRVRGIFLTDLRPDTSAGLAGLLMTFADSGIPRVTVAGPHGLSHLLASTRMYTYRSSMPVYANETRPDNWIPDPNPIYMDQNISVYTFPVHKTTSDAWIAKTKRKRDSSDGEDEEPRKRANIDLSTDIDLASTETTTPPRSPRPGASDQEQKDQELRRMLIEAMFPASKKSSPEEKEKEPPKKQKGEREDAGVKGKRKGKGKAKAELAESQQPAVASTSESAPDQANTPPQAAESEVETGKRAAIPSFRFQLPKFTPPYPESTNVLVIVGPHHRGKFDVHRAKALGVPTGPLMGKLTKGEEVSFKVKVKKTTEDGKEVEVEEGRVVKPKDVMGENEPPGVVIVLDIPTREHIPSVIRTFKRSSFYQRFRSTKPEDLNKYAVRTVYHLCGPRVLEDPRYVEFMNGFADTAHHIVSSPEHLPDPVTFTTAAYSQLRLNKLDPQMFPLPKFSLTPSKSLSDITNLPASTHPMTAGLLTKMRPPAPPEHLPPRQSGDLFHHSISIDPHSSQVINNVELPEITKQKFKEAKADVQRAVDEYNNLPNQQQRRSKWMQHRKRDKGDVSATEKTDEDESEGMAVDEHGSESEVESSGSGVDGGVFSDSDRSSIGSVRSRRGKLAARAQSGSRAATPTLTSTPAKPEADDQQKQEETDQSTKEVHQGVHIRPGHYKKKGKSVVIVPLGTGSAIPTKYRNVSSTLVDIPDNGYILLDCGEGTWGQLARKYGLGSGPKSAQKDGVWKVLNDLRCVYISHIHADHHMGIVQILEKRKMLDPPPTSPLFLISIRPVHLYLRERSDLTDLGIVLDVGENDDPNDTSWLNTNGVIPVMSDALQWNRPSVRERPAFAEPWTDYERSQRAVKSMYEILGLISFTTVPMNHRTPCYGVVIKSRNGWSIAFSGDTQPTNTIVRVGENSTLLIHEATMADDQEAMAKQKAHSTFGQAVEIGKRMKAENILLTHFSARYPKMPPSAFTKPSEETKEPTSVPISTDSTETTEPSTTTTPSIPIFASSKDPVIALAFDHAHLRLGDLWKFRMYIPAIEQSFEDITAVEGDTGEEEVVQEMEVDATEGAK